MSLALDIRDDLAELLDDPDYGRKIVVRRIVPGDYDETTGAVADGTPLSSTTRGLLLTYRDIVVDGTLIKKGDRKCIIKVKGMTLVPQVTDFLDVYDKKGTTVSETLRIVNPVKTGELGGETYLYVAQVRK